MTYSDVLSEVEQSLVNHLATDSELTVFLMGASPESADELRMLLEQEYVDQEATDYQSIKRLSVLAEINPQATFRCLPLFVSAIDSDAAAETKELSLMSISALFTAAGTMPKFEPRFDRQLAHKLIDILCEHIEASDSTAITCRSASALVNVLSVCLRDKSLYLGTEFRANTCSRLEDCLTTPTLANQFVRTKATEALVLFHERDSAQSRRLLRCLGVPGAPGKQLESALAALQQTSATDIASTITSVTTQLGRTEDSLTREQRLEAIGLFRLACNEIHTEDALFENPDSVPDNVEDNSLVSEIKAVCGDMAPVSQPSQAYTEIVERLLHNDVIDIQLLHENRPWIESMPRSRPPEKANHADKHEGSVSWEDSSDEISDEYETEVGDDISERTKQVVDILDWFEQVGTPAKTNAEGQNERIEELFEAVSDDGLAELLVNLDETIDTDKAVAGPSRHQVRENVKKVFSDSLTIQSHDRLWELLLLNADDPDNDYNQHEVQQIRREVRSEISTEALDCLPGIGNRLSNKLSEEYDTAWDILNDDPASIQRSEIGQKKLQGMYEVRLMRLLQILIESEIVPGIETPEIELPRIYETVALLNRPAAAWATDAALANLLESRYSLVAEGLACEKPAYGSAPVRLIEEMAETNREPLGLIARGAWHDGEPASGIWGIIIYGGRPEKQEAIRLATTAEQIVDDDVGQSEQIQNKLAELYRNNEHRSREYPSLFHDMKQLMELHNLPVDALFSG